MKGHPLVSVNIPTYNSAKTLEETLASIKKQTYPNIEIIIADGHSRDQTLAIAKKYKVLVCYAQELGRARYAAFTHSRGEYILFFDSDQIASPDLIKKCVDYCLKTGTDALTISEKSIVQKGTLVEKLIAYDKQVVDSLKDDDAVFGTAVPRFFKAEILKGIIWPKELSVFDHTSIFLEIIKNKAKVEYLSSVSISHHEVDSWRRFFNKFFHYGYCYPQAFKNYPLPVVAHSFPRRAYFSRAALSRPLYFLGLLFLYLVKGLAAGLGVFSYLINSKRKNKTK